MNKVIYALVIIRRYRNVGDTTSILTFDTREAAEQYAADKAAEQSTERELSTAIIEMLACNNGENYPVSVTPTSFGATLNTTTK